MCRETDRNTTTDMLRTTDVTVDKYTYSYYHSYAQNVMFICVNMSSTSTRHTINSSAIDFKTAD